MTSTNDKAAPYTVAIVAMGPSHTDYLAECITFAGRFGVADETWAINAMGGIIEHDVVIIMDALPYFAQLGRTSVHHSGYDKWLRAHRGPIYTQQKYKGYRGSIEYPLEEVINKVGYPYFNNTCAYAIGLAILREVKVLKLYGVDFTHRPDRSASTIEAGRACCESLVRDCAYHGIQVQIAKSSTLCDQFNNRPLYGYSFPPKIVEVNGKYTVTHPERDKNTLK